MQREGSGNAAGSNEKQRESAGNNEKHREATGNDLGSISSDLQGLKGRLARPNEGGGPDAQICLFFNLNAAGSSEKQRETI